MKARLAPVMKLVEWFAHGSLFFMIGTIATNVIARAFFSFSVTGTVEIVGFCSAIFLSAALVFSVAERRNIRVDFLYMRLRRGKKVCDLIGIFSAICALSLLFYANEARFIESFKKGEASQVISGVRIYPFRFFFAFALLLTLLFILRDLCDLRRKCHGTGG